MAIGGVRGYKCSVDYYSVLRVPQNADRLVIKSTYRRLALEFHPDKKDGCLKAAEKMKKINVAHEVLIDPDLKKAYDKVRAKHLSREACFCQVWNEQPDIWNEAGTSIIKAKSSLTCHCENCDPEAKERKEKESAKQERIEQEGKEKQQAEIQRVEEEKKARERAEAQRNEQEKKAMEKREAESIQWEQEKQSRKRKLAEQEQGERIAKTKLQRKRRISDQIEQEHSEREAKRLQQTEQLRVDIERKQELRRGKAVAGPSKTREPTAEATAEPEYSTYWIDHETRTPYYQSIRNDFDRAMKLHKQALEELSRHETAEEMERLDDLVEVRWKNLEARARDWADASSIANRLKRAGAQEKDGRS